ncbi:hypothetical protein OSB04_003160 [Centaurea solstitialis]|uniref:Reverse transcriptase Ty1/copia-type domain-containing protein n=1 Tax=Centaurea solstitialis TaxID=347529 RepID=A0AA38TUM1_9ASTR|nr:hypothetical protein OSB04_003160 [Centaurea solstitialis]
MIRSTKDMLKSKFDMEDMDVILGIKITRTQNGLVLSQTHYVDKILEKCNQGDTSIAGTPIDTSQQNRGDNVTQVKYSRIIGSLMYLMSFTRPDLTYAVSRLSRYTSNPSSITRLLRYLRYTREYGLHYGRYPTVIKGYSDANWISDIKDSKPSSAAIKQSIVARSTMESEFIALDKYGEKVEWLRQFVEDIPKWPKPVTVICIHCDSQSAIGRAQNTMYKGKQVLSGSSPTASAVVPWEQTANLLKRIVSNTSLGYL